jgi:multidrug resistance efflux pump
MKRLILTVFSLTSIISAQNTAPRTEQSQIVDEVTKLRDEFVRLTGDYKKSLGDLLPYQEREAQRAAERLDKMQELKREGLIEQRDVDAAEKTLADARAKVADTQQLMKAADSQIADALVNKPTEVAKHLVAQKKTRERTKDGRIYYVRFVIVGEIEIYDYSGAVKG